MPVTPWKVLETSYVRPGFRVEKCELPNGKYLDATILEFRPWANVIALTPDNEVVLIRQYRHGVREILWEIPGGVIDDGEDPQEGIRREFLEETGYAASEFILTGKLYPNPAIETNSMYCFLALDVKKVDAQNLDAGEDIDVHLVPLNELIEMAENGGFPHALQVAALFLALSYLNKNK